MRGLNTSREVKLTPRAETPTRGFETARLNKYDTIAQGENRRCR